MTLAKKGETFPDFQLGDYSLAKSLENGPVLMIVWRTECPTCRLAMPFVQRLHDRYPTAQILGIAQNRADEISQYAAANGISFTNLPDDTLRFSRNMGIDYVPEYALIDTSGEVLVQGSSWDAEKFEAINILLAELTGAVATPLIAAEDKVPAFKPG